LWSGRKIIAIAAVNSTDAKHWLPAILDSWTDTQQRIIYGSERDVSITCCNLCCH